MAFANGTTVIQDATAEIRCGERVLIQGESGTGKSTLFRAIGGLWPWGAGMIETPSRKDMMFMPQRPYLPLGTLRAAIAYPEGADAVPPEAAVEALHRVGLDQLPGRLAFARLLLHRPGWIFMDEATAALDEGNQDAMMELVLQELPNSALVSIGHRPGLARFHTRTLMLRRAEGGARLSPPRRVRREPGWSTPLRQLGLAVAGRN